ncbi:MAG: PhzF family phenazine biosynthesis protein [Pseudomonadota bacterium]
MSATPKLCTVDVFYGPEALGNQHHIAYRPAPAWGEVPSQYQRVPNLILMSGGSRAFQAQFLDYGRPVRRCGSGNLAVAAYINDRLKTKTTNECLLTPASEIQLGFDHESAYYFDKPLAQRPLRNLGFWRRLISQPVVSGGYCGGRNDYVLLELSQPLTPLNVNSSALCRFSQRALIVIYRMLSGAVQLRYFAPQYGAAEDAATGSASVQAAAYLRNQYPQSYAHQSIEVKQCSPAGGCLYLKNYQQQVLVRGRTAMRDNTAICSSFDYTEK